MPKIQVDDILIRKKQDEDATVVVDGVILKGKRNGDSFNRKYKVLYIGNCGRAGLYSLGTGSDLFCTLFKDWSSFEVLRDGKYIGRAEHYRSKV